MNVELELIACQPHPIESKGFNPNATLPYSCIIEHTHLAMNDIMSAKSPIIKEPHPQPLPASGEGS